MNDIADNIRPFKISFLRLGKTDKFYSSIFLECRKTKELMAANRLAQKLFNRNYVYDPHMSLVYGDINDALKNRVIKLFNPSIIRSFSFIADSVCLYRCFGTASQWKAIKTVPFRARPIGRFG